MVSPRKSASSVNLGADEYGSNGAVNRLTPPNRKSCDSLNSAPSSRASASLVYRRKVPVQFGSRQPALIPATTEVQQRVISARRLRYKNVQNQLGLAQHKITELTNELRVLRTLHKRQNSALAKYEATNAELPRLLHSHAEELRVWQSKYRTLQLAHKDLEQRLKQKEAIILALSDENKYYSQLNKDKNLEDRQRLAEKLQSLDLRLQEKENQMKIAERRSHLEIKNLKHQLYCEQKKTKDVLQKLEKARMELSNYQKLEELNITEKLSNMSIKQTHTKMELKATAKKESRKDKPFGGVLMNSSKTPSPALDNVSGNGGGSVGEEADSDFAVSHRSQRSTSSSVNINFKTTRTVRKMPVKMTSKETISIQIADNMSEIIGDGPDQRSKKFEPNEDNSIARKPVKMMVNMPNFDGAADVDVSLGGSDDADVVLGGNVSDGNDLENIDFNYPDDFDENFDDGNDGDGNLDKYQNENSPNHEVDEPLNLVDDEIEGLTNRSKQSIRKIRKQITEDYNDREAFLDTFCRQATSTSVRNGELLTPKKVLSKTLPETVPSNRKHKLLAALKAIDDDHLRSCQD